MDQCLRQHVRLARSLCNLRALVAALVRMAKSVEWIRERSPGCWLWGLTLLHGVLRRNRVPSVYPVQCARWDSLPIPVELILPGDDGGCIACNRCLRRILLAWKIWLCQGLLQERCVWFRHLYAVWQNALEWVSISSLVETSRSVKGFTWGYHFVWLVQDAFRWHWAKLLSLSSMGTEFLQVLWSAQSLLAQILIA